MSADRVVCAWCGQAAPQDSTEVILAWTVSVEGGRVDRYCPQCARTHLRAIEARLDATDW